MSVIIAMIKRKSLMATGKRTHVSFNTLTVASRSFTPILCCRVEVKPSFSSSNLGQGASSQGSFARLVCS